MANTKSIDLELSSSQYLSITNGDQTGLNITGDISMECWIKAESLGTLQYLIFKSVGATGGYFFQISTDGKIRFKIEAQNGSDITALNTDAAQITSAGVWYHIAVTMDVSVPEGKVYINGSSVAVTQSPSNATSIGTNTLDFAIGSSSAGSSYFDGLIDEVRIWDVLRTPTEISDNYDKVLSSPGSEANLQGYWQMEDDLTDSSQNSNTLTNNNSATFSSSVPFSGATTFIPKIMMS